MRKIKQRQVDGGVLDTEVPPDGKSLLDGLPSVTPDDIEQIGRLLGRFRMERASRETEPAPEIAKTHLEQLAKSAKAVANGLQLLPMDARGLLAEHGHKVSGNGLWLEAVEDALGALSVFASSAAHEYQKGRGRKAIYLETKLLSDASAVLERANFPVTKAAELALQIIKERKAIKINGQEVVERGASLSTAEPRRLIREYRKDKG